MRPSDDPKADKLQNSNMPQPAQQADPNLDPNYDPNANSGI